MIIAEQFYFKSTPRVYLYSNEGKKITNGKHSNTFIIDFPENIKNYAEEPIADIPDDEALSLLLEGVTE